MPEVDTYVLEAVRKAAEGQIEENVYKKIKGDLFRAKVIGTVGAVAVAIALLFYKPIFEFVVSQGGKEFHSAIENSVKDQKAQADEIKRDFKSIGEFAKAESGELRKVVIEARTLIEDEKAQLQTILKSLKDAQQAAQEARETNVQRIAAAQADADAVRKRLEDVISQINALVENQKSIVETLATKPKISDVKPTPTATASNRTTVYFQFAGFTREDAKTISKALQDKGWAIPGEERTTGAIETNQVRFNPANRSMAERLKSDGEEVLKPYGIQLKLVESTAIKAEIPEIWIYRR